MSNKKTSEVWNHFKETNVSNIVNCNYCLQNVTASRGSTGNLIRHMSAKHPSIELRRQPLRKRTIIQPAFALRNRNDQESDAELEGEDNELISEIVYLEDGNDEDEKKYTTIIDHDQRSDAYKRRKRHRDDDAPSEKYRLPKLGRNSMSSTEDDRPVLLVASGKKDNEEADAFSKYLMQLMKSLPKHIQTKLQMEIVNVVMKAKMEYEAKQQEREDEEKNAASAAKDSCYSVTVAREEPLRRVVCRKSEIDTKKDSDVLDGIIGTAVSVGTEGGAMTSEVGLPATFTGIHSL